MQHYRFTHLALTFHAEVTIHVREGRYMAAGAAIESD